MFGKVGNKFDVSGPINYGLSLVQHLIKIEFLTPSTKKMMGHTLNTVDNAYVTIDKETCKHEYMHCIKDLSTEKVEIKKVTSDEIKTIIKENQDLRTDFEDMKKEMEDYKTFKPLINVFMEDDEIQKRVEERLKEK